jgi:hydroxymethylpyrimidine/phosphomethylpyrimidine kinase
VGLVRRAAQRLDRKNTLVIDPVIVFERGAPHVDERRVRSIPRVPTFGVRLRF